jgi:hypothetical protein
MLPAKVPAGRRARDAWQLGFNLGVGLMQISGRNREAAAQLEIALRRQAENEQARQILDTLRAGR